MTNAKDLMRTRVVTVGPDTTLDEAARLFEKHGISGAPVVGPRRKLLGVVSQTDLLRRHQQEAANEVPAFYSDGETLGLVRPVDSASFARVEEVMTPAVLSAEEDTPVAALAAFMLARRIHRVVITRDGALRGLVTTMDLLRLLAAPAAAPARASRGRRASSGRRRSRRRPQAA